MKNILQNKNNDYSIVKIYLIAGLAVAIFAGAYFILELFINEPFTKKDYEVLAFIGDYFGGILNPAFAFLALGALLWSIQIQRTELRETSNTLKIQNFEATFFQLLKLYNEIVQAIVIEDNVYDKKILYKGRAGFERLFGIFKKNYDEISLTNIQKSKEIIYENFYKENGHLIGHQYRIIYNILKFVEKTGWAYPKQKFYTDILRAQLSKYELALLFYNTVHFNGKGKGNMLKMVMKYNLFKHLEKEELLEEFDYSDLEQINEEHIIYRSKISN